LLNFTEILPQTHLFRGIDSPPDQLESLLKTNSEKVLWTTDCPKTAATYIPEAAGKTGISLRNLQENPQPDDGILSDILFQMGIEVTIYDREYQLPQKPHNIPRNVITGEKWGRPTSWTFSQPVKSQDILSFLKTLGYDTQEDFLWLKTTYKHGKHIILPKNHKFTGSLVTFYPKTTLKGVSFANGEGDLLDPQHRKIQQYRKIAQENHLDFLVIDDFCQSEKNGNLAHTSFAILNPKKLKVSKVESATHPE